MKKHHLRHSLRLSRIAYVLAREDALFIFRALGLPLPMGWLLPIVRKRSRKPHGERLAAAFEKLGPSFIKLGQTLSTRADLVGEDIALALGNLRDNLTPFPACIAKATVEKEFGTPLMSIFSRFDEVPVAAASIAQVHKARTIAGKEVAVKILRPNIEADFKRDLDLFDWLAQRIEANLPTSRRLKPIEVVQLFKQAVAMELDLRFEASAAAELAENTKEDAKFHVPAVDWNLTAQRAMVLDWVEGTKLSDVEALKAQGVNLNALLATLSESFFKQAFRDGFFHADMHPGNLLVGADGTVTAVDFGIMGRLDWETRLYVAEIFRGFLNKDFTHVAEAHFKAGYVPKHHDVAQFAMACRAIAMPILDRPASEVSVGRLLGQLFKVTETFDMETQPQLLLLQKNMVVLEGLGRMLNPEVNMWELARGPIEEWAMENLSIKARVLQGLRHGRELLENAPRLLKQLEESLEASTHR